MVSWFVWGFFSGVCVSVPPSPNAFYSVVNSKCSLPRGFFFPSKNQNDILQCTSSTSPIQKRLKRIGRAAVMQKLPGSPVLRPRPPYWVGESLPPDTVLPPPHPHTPRHTPPTYPLGPGWSLGPRISCHLPFPPSATVLPPCPSALGVQQGIHPRKASSWSFLPPPPTPSRPWSGPFHFISAFPGKKCFWTFYIRVITSVSPQFESAVEDICIPPPDFPPPQIRGRYVPRQGCVCDLAGLGLS